MYYDRKSLSESSPEYREPGINKIFNFYKSIALVMDNKVYYAPKVMEEIKNGRCKISGDFSVKEAKMLISLIVNGELPLDFELIE